jgi:hypothetical protein
MTSERYDSPMIHSPRLFLLLFVIGIFLGSDAFAQTLPAPEGAESQRLFSPEHRQQLYDANRLSERRALLYSAALPGLGNFYAEQYALGTVALSALVFSAVFIAYGLANNQRGLANFGIGLAIVTYGGAAGTSFFGVRSYNERLRRSLHLDRPIPP